MTGNKEPWIKHLDDDLDDIYLRQQKIADAVFNVRESRIADALVLAAASYRHSRVYELTRWEAFVGGVKLFWRRVT